MNSAKGPSRVVFGCAVLVLALGFVCGGCGVSTSRGFIRFQNLTRVDAGTALGAFVVAAEADEFVRDETQDDGPDDAGVATWSLVKRNLPPVGPWRVFVKHAEGRVLEVTTVIPD